MTFRLRCVHEDSAPDAALPAVCENHSGAPRATATTATTATIQPASAPSVATVAVSHVAEGERSRAQPPEAVAHVATVAVAPASPEKNQHGPQSIRCRDCRHFRARPGESPDGYCHRYTVETWATVPLACAGFEDADSPSAAARAAVLAELERHWAIERAFRVRQDGDVHIVTLAVRGVGVCELAIPAERLNGEHLAEYGALLACLDGSDVPA